VDEKSGFSIDQHKLFAGLLDYNDINKNNNDLPVVCRLEIKFIPLAFNHLTTTLTIDRVRREDYGSYRCQIKNSIGSSTQRVQLLGEPALLSYIQASAAEHTMIHN